MSFVIEQDHNQARLASSLQRHADIKSIRVMEGTFNCHRKFEDVVWPLQYSIKHDVGQVTIVDGTLMVSIGFGLKGMSEESAIFIIGCRLEVDYSLDEGYTPTDEQVEAFKEGNAIFNCWTYFREFVQSSVARMNFPPLTIPFMRLSIKSVPAEQSQRQIEPIEPKADEVREAPSRRKRGRVNKE